MYQTLSDNSQHFASTEKERPSELAHQGAVFHMVHWIIPLTFSEPGGWDIPPTLIGLSLTFRTKLETLQGVFSPADILDKIVAAKNIVTYKIIFLLFCNK